MSLIVDNTAQQWEFSVNGSSSMSMSDAGWTQRNATLSDDGTVLWTSTFNSSAILVFQGTGITLYSVCSPMGGRMNVSVDFNTTTVGLYSEVLQPVTPMYISPSLDPSTTHALMVTFWDGNGIPGAGVNIDKVGVDPAPPSAFPPSPQPLSFLVSPTSSSLPTQIVTSTATVTTGVPSSKPSPPIGNGGNNTLGGGAIAGIAVGSVSIVALFLFVCVLLGRRNTKRRPPSWPGSLTAIRNIRDSAPSGLRGFLLGKRYSLGSSKGEPGFERIQDQEQNREYYPYGNGGFGAGKEEYEEDEKEKGAREIDLLPEIKHASTLSTFSFPQFVNREDFEEINVPVFESPPPSSNVFSNTQSNVMHARNGSVAVSIRVDTSVATAVGSRRRPSRIGRTPRQVHRHTISAFSGSSVSGTASDEYGSVVHTMHDQAQGNALEAIGDEDGEDGKGAMSEDDGDFYLMHLGYGSRSSRMFPASPPHEEVGGSIEGVEEGEQCMDRDDDAPHAEMDEGDYDDDCTTPLLESPALPSTHASSLLSHGHALGSSSNTRMSRPRRQSTRSSRYALQSSRSVRTGSRSSLRYSVGKKPSVRSLAASVVGVFSGSRSSLGATGSASASGSAPASASSHTPSGAGPLKTPISAGATSFRTSTGTSHSHYSQSLPSAAASRSGTGETVSSDSPSVFRFPPPPIPGKRTSGGTVNSETMVFPPPLPSAALTMSSSSSGPTVRAAEATSNPTPTQNDFSVSAVTTSPDSAMRELPRPTPNTSTTARMQRTHRPAYGPRARGASNGSISSITSVSGSASSGSSSDAAVLVPRSGLGGSEDDGRLSTVEESLASRAASGRPSVDESVISRGEQG